MDFFKQIKKSGIRMVFVALVLSLFLTTGLADEGAKTGRRKFYSIEELIRLIERGRESGMSEEALGKLELRDGDKQINVLDYIEKEKLKKLKKDKKLKELLEKKFLTVNDIYGELIKQEPRVIEQLREELVSER